MITIQGLHPLTSVTTVVIAFIEMNNLKGFTWGFQL